MAVFQMNDKPHGKSRELPWCCELPDQTGRKRRTFFKTKTEARSYEAKEKERRRTSKTGMYSVQDLKNFTVRDIVRSYIGGEKLITEDDDIYDDKAELEEGSLRPENEFLVLWKFSLRSICNLSLYDFNRSVAEKYIQDRLKETWKPPGSVGEGKLITPGAVRREITTIQAAWKVAKKRPGLELLENPWTGITIEGSTGEFRERRLEEGEQASLEEACKKCLGLNRIYVPLAMYLAVETGMRLQEIFNLTWEDLDFEKRRIEIRKSKTDRKARRKGRIIVMSVMAMIIASRLPFQIAKETGEPARMVPTDPVFRNLDGTPLTKSAFKQAWADVKKRAKIVERLTFHDLRHEAGSRFDEAELTKVENEQMMGHKGKDTNSRYIHARLKSIQDKLDKHFLGGKTFEEVEAEVSGHQAEFEGYFKDGLQEGLGRQAATEKATARMFEKYPGYARVKAFIASLPSTQARLTEEVA